MGDPREGLRKLSGQMTVDDVMFEAWRTGVLTSKWVSADGRIVLQGSYRYGRTATCRVDEVFILSKASGQAKQFRSLRAAAAAGVSIAKQGAPCSFCRQRAGFTNRGQCKHCGRKPL